MKYLITGVSGFVGSHLVKRLAHEGHELYGIDAYPPAAQGPIVFEQASLMDRAAIAGFLKKIRPDRIIHLASASSVAYSWQQPVECFVNNTNIFLNLVDTVRELGLRCRVLSVGSSEEYGPVSPGNLPLREDAPVNPMNPYAVARVAQEQLSKVFCHGYGMDIVCTRSFNHLGPGQSERFVVASFVKQALLVARKKKDAIVCGDLDIVRDFVDVRDVISAYILILDKGSSGEIYNVCSGEGVSLQKVLEYICSKVGIKYEPVTDPALVRPIDNPVIIGSNERLKGLGFHLQYDLHSSLDSMIKDSKNTEAGP